MIINLNRMSEDKPKKSKRPAKTQEGPKKTASEPSKPTLPDSSETAKKVTGGKTGKKD